MLLVQVAVVLVTRMVPSALACGEVEVVDLLRVRGLAWLPVLGQWRFQALARDPEEVSLAFQVHAEPRGVLQHLFLCRFIVRVDLLLQHDAVTLAVHGDLDLASFRPSTETM